MGEGRRHCFLVMHTYRSITHHAITRANFQYVVKNNRQLRRVRKDNNKYATESTCLFFFFMSRARAIGNKEKKCEKNSLETESVFLPIKRKSPRERANTF
eukprot:GEMP01007907.1.p2 GENE.GEMP01007907.1~~GEMP01007907.1.p2  ORF type:complete len:100 (-),score=10.09 GEMP01007907.1:3223-3522(-)